VSDRLRLLTIFASITVFAEAIMLAVLPPMLPHLVREFSLSAGVAGVVTASYSAGVLAGTMPAGIAESRLGPRSAARLGLGLLALGSLGFAIGSSPSALIASRFVSAVGAAVAWAGALAWIAHSASADKRGAAFGTVLGAAFAGTLAAPVLALVVSHSGRAEVFTALAVGFGLAALWGGPGDIRSESSGLSARRMLALLKIRGVALPLTAMTLTGVILGGMISAGPLLLSARGFSNATIALVFLIAYAPQVVVSPAAGRVIDRLGPRPVLAALLLAAAVLSPVVGVVAQHLVLVAAFVMLYTVLLAIWAPISVWISRSTEAHAGSQGFAVALTNGAWGIGSMLGAVVLLTVADALSYQFAFALAALVALAAAGVATGRPRRLPHSGVESDRAPLAPGAHE
jgi:predicted MFS family arabinose efflux permease